MTVAKVLTSCIKFDEIIFKKSERRRKNKKYFVRFQINTYEKVVNEQEQNKRVSTYPVMHTLYLLEKVQNKLALRVDFCTRSVCWCSLKKTSWNSCRSLDVWPIIGWHHVCSSILLFLMGMWILSFILFIFIHHLFIRIYFGIEQNIFDLFIFFLVSWRWSPRTWWHDV